MSRAAVSWAETAATLLWPGSRAYIVMRLRVRFFAAYRELANTKETGIELRSPATLEGVLDALFSQYPRLKQELLDDRGELRDYVAVLVNGRNVRDLMRGATPVREGDEIALFPPVAGGRA